MVEADVTPLAKIMRKLRDKDSGCPWDIEQDFASIAPYTIEEAYEVADAIERGDMIDLRDELGDLLLQVVFHSQMAAEAGSFTLQNVIDGICNKMIRRHPHVFANEDADDAETVVRNWEQIKAEERAGKAEDQSALSGVASALPALLRAQKLQKRAARSGFDWPDIDGPISKIREEIEEVKNASTAQGRKEEVGDLLFAVVNLARHLGIDAEQALKAGNRKFEGRFRKMEKAAGPEFEEMDLEAKEQLWQAAKKDMPSIGQ